MTTGTNPASSFRAKRTQNNVLEIPRHSRDSREPITDDSSRSLSRGTRGHRERRTRGNAYRILVRPRAGTTMDARRYRSRREKRKTREDASVSGSPWNEGENPRSGHRENNGPASRAFLRAETPLGRLLAAMCSACVKFHCSADAQRCSGRSCNLGPDIIC